MALGFSIALTLAILALVAVPAGRLGKRLGTPAAERNATPEEQAERKRLRAAQRRAGLAALTPRERVLFYAYYAVSIPTMPAGVLLAIFGRGTTRTAGVALLVIAALLTAVPVGPILGGRARRRKRASAAAIEPGWLLGWVERGCAHNRDAGPEWTDADGSLESISRSTGPSAWFSRIQFRQVRRGGLPDRSGPA